MGKVIESLVIDANAKLGDALKLEKGTLAQVGQNCFPGKPARDFDNKEVTRAFNIVKAAGGREEPFRVRAEIIKYAEKLEAEEKAKQTATTDRKRMSATPA